MLSVPEVLQCPGQPALCAELARFTSFRNSNQTKVQQVVQPPRRNARKASRTNTASSSPPALHSPPSLPLLCGCAQREGALKLSAVGFTSSDSFLKQQQHKVLVWLSGNLKPWRQSSPPPKPPAAAAAGQERQRSGTARGVSPRSSPGRAESQEAPRMQEAPLRVLE